MVTGGGFLKQMNDTIKYNRDLMRKKKSLKEVYREEVNKRNSRFNQTDLVELRQRVKEKLRRNFIQEFIARTVAILLLLTFIGGIFWIMLQFS